jgi:hypothetical protein
MVVLAFPGSYSLMRVLATRACFLEEAQPSFRRSNCVDDDHRRRRTASPAEESRPRRNHDGTRNMSSLLSGARFRAHAIFEVVFGRDSVQLGAGHGVSHVGAGVWRNTFRNPTRPAAKHQHRSSQQPTRHRSPHHLVLQGLDSRLNQAVGWSHMVVAIHHVVPRVADRPEPTLVIRDSDGRGGQTFASGQESDGSRSTEDSVVDRERHTGGEGAAFRITRVARVNWRGHRSGPSNVH